MKMSAVLSALAKSPSVQAAWEKLATRHKREHLRQIEGAKRAKTRERRIAKLIDQLSAGGGR